MSVACLGAPAETAFTPSRSFASVPLPAEWLAPRLGALCNALPAPRLSFYGVSLLAVVPS